MFILHSAMLEKSSDEVIIHCPFCNYYFISLKQHTMGFVYCQKGSCFKVSCLDCKKEIENIDCDYDDDEEEIKKVGLYEHHFKCHELRQLKLDLDEIIENGLKRACPKCGLKGLKDDACTHMACLACYSAISRTRIWRRKSLEIFTSTMSTGI